MLTWCELFNRKENEGVTLTIKGKTFKRSDCVKLGQGVTKIVYKAGDQNLCFSLPTTICTSEDWSLLNRRDKMLLDQIIDLGLKAQQFEIEPIEIRDSENTVSTINVLLTRDFESLCKEESIVLYNHKGDQRVIGQAPDFVAMKSKFKDPSFVRKMFNKIIKEYAVAFTFSLPITILQNCDDSEHYLFELSQDPNEAPVVRYMFWDVMGDFSGVSLPMVPTLKDLRAGAKDESHPYGFASPTRGTRTLTNAVACAMYTMNDKQLCNNYRFVPEVEKDLELAINQDDFLTQALDHAKNKATEFLTKKLDKDDPNISRNEFVTLMLSAISTANLDLVIRVFKLYPRLTDLSEDNIGKIMKCSKKYDNQAIIEYLNANLVSPILKMKFFKKYDERLHADQRAWYGMSSFFAKSYVNWSMPLEELVLQAQGLSKQGVDQRSFTVMKELGWLSDSKQLSSELDVATKDALSSKSSKDKNIEELKTSISDKLLQLQEAPLAVVTTELSDHFNKIIYGIPMMDCSILFEFLLTHRTTTSNASSQVSVNSHINWPILIENIRTKALEKLKSANECMGYDQALVYLTECRSFPIFNLSNGLTEKVGRTSAVVVIDGLKLQRENERSEKASRKLGK